MFISQYEWKNKTDHILYKKFTVSIVISHHNCVPFQTYHMLIAQTEAEELPTVTVNPYFSFGPVTKAVSEMKQHLNEFSNEELVKVAKSGE